MKLHLFALCISSFLYASEVPDIHIKCTDEEIVLPGEMHHDSEYVFKTGDVLQHSLTIKNQCNDANSGCDICIPVSKKEFDSIFPWMQLTQLASCNYDLAELRAAQEFPQSMESASALAEIASILDIYNIKRYALCHLADKIGKNYSGSFLGNPKPLLELFRFKPEMSCNANQKLNPDLCGDLAQYIVQASFIRTVLNKKATQKDYCWSENELCQFSSKLNLWRNLNLFSIVDSSHTHIFHININGKIIMRDTLGSGKITSMGRIGDDRLLYGTNDGYLKVLPYTGEDSVISYRHPISLLSTCPSNNNFLMYTKENNVLRLIKEIPLEMVKTNFSRDTSITGASMSAQGTHYIITSNVYNAPGVEQVSLYSSDECKLIRTFDFISTQPIRIAHNPKEDFRYVLTNGDHTIIALGDAYVGTEYPAFFRCCDNIKRLVWSSDGDMLASVEETDKKGSIFVWDPRMQTHACRIQREGIIKNFTWDKDATHGVFFEKRPNGLHTMTCIDTRMLTRDYVTKQSFIDHCLSIRSLDKALLLNGIAHAVNQNETVFFTEDTQAIYDSMDDTMKPIVNDLIASPK